MAQAWVYLRDHCGCNDHRHAERVQYHIHNRPIGSLPKFGFLYSKPYTHDSGAYQKAADGPFANRTLPPPSNLQLPMYHVVLAEYTTSRAYSLNKYFVVPDPTLEVLVPHVV